jgi:hypothetical protein
MHSCGLRLEQLSNKVKANIANSCYDIFYYHMGTPRYTCFKQNEAALTYMDCATFLAVAQLVPTHSWVPDLVKQSKDFPAKSITFRKGC